MPLNEKEFNEKIVASSIKFSYEDDYVYPAEWFNCKRFEDFLISKGFLILEYFVQSHFCSFILLQMPKISETVMIYVNRTKYPINVTQSSYKKTEIEKLKVERQIEDQIDYENISLDGFEQSHSLDRIGDTNSQQKSLSYYIKRQLSRMMYITKNIEIKPCLLMKQFFGFHDIYHMIDRMFTREFFPVISLEILFSKTFILEQNLPVFYNKFYSIINQSNVNKIQSLEISLSKLMSKIRTIKDSSTFYSTLERDQIRVKSILFKLIQKEEENQTERQTTSIPDPIASSYHMKRLDEEKLENDRRRRECNSIYMDIKKEYDYHVFENEICFYELFDKIKDIEDLVLHMS